MFTRSILEFENLPQSGKVTFCSPSNIALIKYWGKYGVQLPKNPSLSITLDKAHTQMSITYTKKDRDGVEIDFLFEGNKRQDFQNKIQVFLESIIEQFPFLDKYHLSIESKNTFPHSSGIASSASSMSALAMCLCEIESQLISASGVTSTEQEMLKKASYIARLGSGSASRSLFPKMSLWGECFVQGSANEYAIDYSEFHESFLNMHDSVVIVSKGEKAVSSRAGHALMDSHPFAQVRFKSANDNLISLIAALKEGDFDSFCEIVEIEALELHGLMMNSRPSYTLMEPNTLEVIKRIRKFRHETGTQICFTLDAGPNVHILYPVSAKDKCLEFINSQIVPLAQDELVIHDNMGQGAKRLSC